MRVVIASVLLTAIVCASNVFSSVGSDKTFNADSLTLCSSQCVERLLGMPMFLNKDNMKFICCQKFENTETTKCIKQVKTACYQGDVTSDMIAKYAEQEAKICQKGKTEKSLMQAYQIDEAKKKEFKDDDTNQELIDHIKNKSDPIKKFIKDNWNWKNNETWKSDDSIQN